MMTVTKCRFVASPSPDGLAAAQSLQCPLDWIRKILNERQE